VIAGANRRALESKNILNSSSFFLVEQPSSCPHYGTSSAESWKSVGELVRCVARLCPLVFSFFMSLAAVSQAQLKTRPHEVLRWISN
jgi:hypothetical protein